MEEIKREGEIGQEWDKIRAFTDNLLDHPELQPKTEDEAEAFFGLLRQKVGVIKKLANKKHKSNAPTSGV